MLGIAVMFEARSSFPRIGWMPYGDGGYHSAEMNGYAALVALVAAIAGRVVLGRTAPLRGLVFAIWVLLTAWLSASAAVADLWWTSTSTVLIWWNEYLGTSMIGAVLFFAAVGAFGLMLVLGPGLLDPQR